MNLGTLTEDLIESFRSEYPDVRFRTDIADDAEVAVFPTCERAIAELIENAAKHTDESPTVEITVNRVPNAVEIQIADDGPGLSDQEQAVFSTGIETPLIHGSGLGLWVVHWIVSSHGGRTEAVIDDDGTTMTISIPHGPDVDHEDTVAELQRARDLYEAAFEEALDAMVIIDDDAKILEANRQVKEIFGLDRQELLGRSLKEFLPESFDFESAWEEFKDDGAIGTVEFNRADGEARKVEYTGKPEVIPGQHFVIYRDLTHRLELEDQLAEEQQFADAILNAIPNLLYVFDPDGYPIRWNAPVEDATGYSADEIPEMHVTEFIPDDEVEKVTTAFSSVIHEGQTVTVVSAYETKDGERIPYEFTGAPVEDADGELLGMAGIGRQLATPATASSNSRGTLLEE